MSQRIEEEDDEVKAVGGVLSVIMPVIERVKLKNTHFDAGAKCVPPSRRVTEQTANLTYFVHLLEKRLESKWPSYQAMPGWLKLFFRSPKSSLDWHPYDLGSRETKH
jgi:hypothetical protein